MIKENHKFLIDKYYQTAQICENGHVITSSVEDNPEQCEKFCHHCGAKTLTNCPRCKNSIRGDYVYIDREDIEYGPIILEHMKRPSFCPDCGQPFPWTVKAVAAAKELVAADSKLSDQDKNDFKNNVEKLTHNSFETISTAIQVKKILLKVGAVTAEGLKDILVSIVSESAKKILWP